MNEMFAVGSGFLFAAGLSVFASPLLARAGAYAFLVFIGLLFFFILAIGLAIVFFVFAMHLLADLTRNHLLPRVLFGASIAALVGGFIIYTLPIQQSVGFVLLFGWLLLPFVPWIFGPVVMAHGFIFALMPRLQPKGAGFAPFLSGCVFLITFPIVAIVAQSVGLAYDPIAPSNPLGLLLAGLTGVGYFLVRLGLGIEYEDIRLPLQRGWFRVGSREARPPTSGGPTTASESDPTGTRQGRLGP